jgi:hypothetical protein
VWEDAIGPAGWQGAQKQAKGSANAPSVQGRIHRRAPQQLLWDIQKIKGFQNLVP